jgi:chitinase
MIQEKTRRLSPWRVMLAVFIVIAACVGSFYGFQWWKSEQSQASHKPWFASYVDVTSTPTFTFEQLSKGDHKDVMLSFIVSSTSKDCVPSWGGSFTLDRAGDSLDLDRRIARLKQQGGNVAVSFGGLKNKELATSCDDVASLKAAYKAVIDRYNLDTIDLDIEQGNLTDTAASERRAVALAELQAEQRTAGKSLAVWLTLPVSPTGLTEAGTNIISQLLTKKVDIAGVNVMTMDYGQSLNGLSMIDAAKKALTATHRQLGVVYQRAGIYLNDATLWSKIGATPMIGQNDFENEVFTLDDAIQLNKFAREKGMARMSMWSANRDITCGSNYTTTKVVSDSCSGVKEDAGAFANALGSGFNGSFALSAGVITNADTGSKQVKDDPATSPYPIWSDDGTYLQGTKVVWLHNVYEAKWWTQGNQPDNPVLQEWETPWKLVGPVLPGEKPVQQATLPEGTYAEWAGSTEYDAGQRVLFKGAPYQAKWWNKGQSPAAASSNPDSSPWVPLTQAQINEIKGE